MATPAAEVDIDERLVRGLLRTQRPDLHSLPVRVVANGWDNTVVRLGDHLMARLPRRAMAADLIVNEQRWLPVLAPLLPLPVPVPEFVGEPTADYPWTWSIGPWLPGRSAAESPPIDPLATADTLGAFIRALHVPAPGDAPTNPFRGVALAARAEAVDGRVAALADRIDAHRTLATWHTLLQTPAWDGPPLWLHGDLHPSNMLTLDGRLSAVIDFGDLTAGDPGTDLAVAWMLFDEPQRARFRDAADVDPHTWRRAAGWALSLSLAYLTGDDSTSMPAIGRSTLAAVLDEFG
jgi:aminoglycoside phosphotransferase (APT) family kinase protein